jgi:hypothetical protein
MGSGPVVGFCEDITELFVSINDKEFIEWFSIY